MRIVENRSKGILERLDILPVRCDEQVQILGEPRQTVEIQRRSAEYHIANALALESSQNLFDCLVIHRRL